MKCDGCFMIYCEGYHLLKVSKNLVAMVSHLYENP